MKKIIDKIINIKDVIVDKFISVKKHIDKKITSKISTNKKNTDKYITTKKKTNKKEKLDYKTLTVSQIEAELKRTKYNEKYVKILKSTIYSLIIIISIATIIATLLMPVFQINSSSMSNTFNEGDIVVSLKTKKINQGDVIAFYHGNKILVKRVIAGSGSWVVIDTEGNVSVDGQKIEETYVENKTLGEYDIEFPYQVPDGEWFVLSDQRQVSIDSRNAEIGCIQQEDIIGKILFRIWPLKKSK